MAVVPPSLVKIGPLFYGVDVIDSLTAKAGDIVANDYIASHAEVPGGLVHADDDVPLLGITDPHMQLIQIEGAGAGPTVRANTLLHEVMHACLAMAGITDVLTDEDEERVVRRLSPLLLQALRDNPGLVTYLVDA